MAVHQAEMRHTHCMGLLKTHTHSMATFIGIARSLMKIGKTGKYMEPHKADTNTLLHHVYMDKDTTPPPNVKANLFVFAVH